MRDKLILQKSDHLTPMESPHSEGLAERVSGDEGQLDISGIEKFFFV